MYLSSPHLISFLHTPPPPPPLSVTPMTSIGSIALPISLIHKLLQSTNVMSCFAKMQRLRDDLEKVRVCVGVGVQVWVWMCRGARYGEGDHGSGGGYASKEG